MIYLYTCPKCGKEQDGINTVEDRHNSPTCDCGTKTELTICPVKTIGYVYTFTPHYDYQLGKHFDTMEEKKAFLSSTGRTQISGDSCPHGKEGMRVACTKDEAKKIDSGAINPFSDRKKITVAGKA